jgi:protein-S-isoprenylcysteine O-methyltransferase Ste14
MSDASTPPTPTSRRRLGLLTGGSAIGAAWFALWFFLVFPAGVLYLSGSDWIPPPGFTRWLGGGLIAAAHLLLLRPVRAFIIEGRGTHVPIAPPSRLVLSALYTRVRNPMYSIYVVIALGEAILFRSVALLGYAAFLFGLAHWYIVTFEEPELRRRFGDDYDAYCARVGRWLPIPRRRV